MNGCRVPVNGRYAWLVSHFSRALRATVHRAPHALRLLRAWLQVVHATDQASGNDTTLVLLLSGPVYNATAGTLAFNVTPAGAGSAPKLSGGAAASALANAQAVSLRRPAAGLQLSVRPCLASRKP